MQARAYGRRRGQPGQSQALPGSPPPLNSLADSLFLAASLITQADAALVQIVTLSLRVSGTACLLGALQRLG